VLAKSTSSPWQAAQTDLRAWHAGRQASVQRLRPAYKVPLTGPAPTAALPFSWFCFSWFMTLSLHTRCSCRRARNRGKRGKRVSELTAEQLRRGRARGMGEANCKLQAHPRTYSQPLRAHMHARTHLQPALQLVHAFLGAGHVGDGAPAQPAVAKGHVAAAQQHKQHDAESPQVA
jgi:hypothetical protein